MGTSVITGWILVLASLIGGAYYCALGIAALKHLSDATALDRSIGWTLWWFLEESRYDDEGRRLCRRGAVVFMIAWSFAVPGYYLALRT
jgi:hypothetical protein